MAKPPLDITGHAATIIEFNRFVHDKNYPGDRHSLGILVEDMLLEMLEDWMAYNNTAGKWKIGEGIDMVDVIFVHASDETTAEHIELLINKDGILLFMEIASPQNIPLMPDEFWLEWLQLSKLGNLGLFEHDIFPNGDEEKYRQLFPASASTIFRLIRNTVGWPLLYGFPADGGKFEINWPFDQYSVEEVFTNGRKAFERFCWLNGRLIEGK